MKILVFDNTIEGFEKLDAYVGLVFFILLCSIFLFFTDLVPSYMIEITAFHDMLRVRIVEIVVESLLAILLRTSH